jgi:hypothetical protein
LTRRPPVAAAKQLSEPKPKAPVASTTATSATFSRLSINISHSIADALKQLSTMNQTSVTEEVRRAVSVYRALDQRLRAGARIVLEYPDGKSTEVEFF